MKDHMTHLTDEQFADCLSHLASAGVMRHLDECAQCRGELASVEESLVEFNQLSLSWAEQQAPSRIPVPSRAKLYWNGPFVRSAIAAMLVAAVFLTASYRRAHETIADPAASHDSLGASMSPRDDDQLLLAIGQEIEAGQQSPVSASDLDIPVHRRGDAAVTKQND